MLWLSFPNQLCISEWIQSLDLDQKPPLLRLWRPHSCKLLHLGPRTCIVRVPQLFIIVSIVHHKHELKFEKINKVPIFSHIRYQFILYAVFCFFCCKSEISDLMTMHVKPKVCTAFHIHNVLRSSGAWGGGGHEEEIGKNEKEVKPAGLDGGRGIYC